MSLQAIRDEYGDILKKWSVFEYDNEIRVSLVVIDQEQRGKGYGREIFKAINSYADSTGKAITLTPDSSFGTTRSTLIRFYKSLGFVVNKGKNKDYEISDLMYRRPKGLQEMIFRLIDEALSEL